MKTGVDCRGKKWVERKLIKTAKDFTNQTFGMLTAILPVQMSSGRAGWLCKCQCGDEIIACTSDLTGHKIISCGTCGREANDRRRAQQMIGQRFGNLVVKELSHCEKGRGFYYRCQCDCGGEITTLGISLRDGNTKSCGHCSRKAAWTRNREDLTGQTFGWLTVKKYLYSKQYSYWECECKCGNTCIANGTTLKYGSKKSCGCLHSIGEANITAILQNNNISFQSQWSAEDLLSDKKSHLYFDFALLDENQNVIRLIEFDGEQHFQPITHWFGGEEAFSVIQRRDNLKNQYAFNHNIPLVRIPHTERDNITLDLLLGDKYLLHSPS